MVLEINQDIQDCIGDKLNKDMYINVSENILHITLKKIKTEVGYYVFDRLHNQTMLNIENNINEKH